jgi:hypothetical protein
MIELQTEASRHHLIDSKQAPFLRHHRGHLADTELANERAGLIKENRLAPAFLKVDV